MYFPVRFIQKYIFGYEILVYLLIRVWERILMIEFEMYELNIRLCKKILNIFKRNVFFFICLIFHFPTTSK